MENRQFLRHTAQKVRLAQLLQGEFIEGNENQASFLKTSKGEELFRLNVIAIVVDIEKVGSITNIMLDDSTGRVMVRSFEESQAVQDLQVGNVVLIIGKIRQYNQEKYLSAEIIKQVDPLWLQVRAKEHPAEKIVVQKVEKESSKVEDVDIEVIEEVKENNVQEEKGAAGGAEVIEEAPTNSEDEEMLPVQKICKIIQDNDSGDGVPIEEVIEKSPINDTEDIIQRMLEAGDIFQNQPGRVKVL